MTASTGKFSGYASVFSVPDRQRDVVVKGAFAATIKGRTNDIKVLWQHDFLQPIGFLTSIREDEYGLLVEGELLFDIQKGREAYTLLKSGAVGGLSIGFTSGKTSFEEIHGYRLIHDLELWEISIVTFPANTEAKVSRVKGDTKNENEEFEKSVEWIAAKRNGDAVRLFDALAKAINSTMYS